MSMVLEGIRVIDVSQIAAAPMAARHLADFGADVIHIENTETGDAWRSYQSTPDGLGFVGTPSDIPYLWEAFNRNKKSLSVNLATKEGQAIVHKLVKDADVFVTNLMLSQRDKLRMDYETLDAINPNLVYGSVTGYGLEGPDRDMPAYDTTAYFHRSGVNHMLMGVGKAYPVNRAAFGDSVTGLFLAFGIMSALYARDTKNGIGTGQQVETSLMASGIYQVSPDMAGTLVTGIEGNEYGANNFQGTAEELAERNRLGAAAADAVGGLLDFFQEAAPNPLSNNYHASDERLVRLNCVDSQRYWSTFCKLASREDLEHDDRFSTMETREQNCRQLYHIVKDVIASKTQAQWRSLLKGLPASTTQNLVEVMEDPQSVANNYFPTFDHPNYGPMKVLASPVNLSKTPATIRSPAPEFSQHTEEILLDEGYEWDAIVELKDQGVIPV